jgi:hypothetical protein
MLFALFPTSRKQLRLGGFLSALELFDRGQESSTDAVEVYSAQVQLWMIQMNECMDGWIEI